MERRDSVLGEQQHRQLVRIHVVDPREAGLDRTRDFAGQEAHGVERVLGDLVTQQLVVAVELLVVDHCHHPALVGVDKIRELEFGIVQIQGHRTVSTFLSLPCGLASGSRAGVRITRSFSFRMGG